ncbi:hypothetical protein G3574_20965 [Noviherbaspirillum sp. 17J57-3]|uniref:Uncharacterized protein n=2 Tax=Noviherbaspirillum galbum TaxID=2709383 RepID=A0A6B3SS30_9BURK|nr:hypothetical protein [Noviherbaspirillum galbum]
MTVALSAQADVSVIGEVGTTGIGFHAAVPVRESVNVRLGLGYLGYSYHGSARDMNYELSMRASTYDALVDWYPMQDSAFRMTAGLAYNANKIDVAARPNASGNYVVNGNTYGAANTGKVTGKVDFGKVAPYLGIGWARKVDKGWSVSSDVGLLFQGSPRSTLRVSGCTAPGEVCSQFASDVARENASLTDEVGRFKVYPVLRVGLSYKF